MAHSHSHTEHDALPNYRRAFAIGITLNVSYVIAETVFGLLAHSLALVDMFFKIRYIFKHRHKKKAHLGGKYHFIHC